MHKTCAPAFTASFTTENSHFIAMVASHVPSSVMRTLHKKLAPSLAVVKDGYIYAQDVMDHVAKPETQERLGARKTTILLSTTQHWMCKLDWRYGCKKNGMYIDGHKHEDVVQYWNEFLARWNMYEK